jgi:O-antigen/teichoic acid export membrane protein
MGIVIRQSAKTVLLSYAGFALGYINTLLLFPLVLSKEQIGLVRLVINISVFFATFASLGSPNIPNRYFFYFKDEKEQHHGLLFFLLTLGTIGYALFIAVFMMYKETIIGFYSGNAFLLVRYIPLILPFTLIMT